MTLLRLRSVLAFVLLGVACAGPGSGMTAYVGAELFDGTGAPVIHDAVVIVAGGRIEAAGPPDLVKIPRGADVVRLDGRWIIPGLIDAGTHVERWALRAYLAYGVTSVRDVGGVQDSVIFLRTDVESGDELGPRLFISGAAIDGPPGDAPGVTMVRTPSDARRAVGARVLIDAAQIKILPKMTWPLMEALLDEARALKTTVTAQLGKVNALTAARAGVSVIEQLSGIVEATVRDPTPFVRAHSDFYRGWNLVERSWGQLDSVKLDRTARALAEERVTLVPTLVVHEAYAHLTNRDYVESLDLSGVPEPVRAAWDLPGLVRRAGLSRADFAAFRRSRPVQDRFVRLFRRAGGRIAVGSNSPTALLAPGAALHDEMELLVAAGLSTKEALLAATRDAARLLQADSLGVLLEGKLADFVVLTADPLADITNTRRIMWVISRGMRYNPDELRTP